MDSSPHQHGTRSFPGILLSLLFLGFSVLTWPLLLERFVSLDWRIGNVRPLAYGLQGFFFLLSVAALLAGKRVGALYEKAFPTRKQLAFTLLTVLLSLTLCLAVAEGVFRLVHFPFMEVTVPSENAMGRYDEDVGWSYKPNHSAMQPFGSENRYVPMFFSDIGSRIRRPGDKYDPEAPTVIFVGGSYTFGHGLFYEETFPGILDERSDFPYQVVNLGVQGYGTDQSYLLLKRVFHKFNTKAVVYTCMCDHPFRNANYDRRVMHPKNRFLGTKCLFGLKDDGTLFLKRKPRRTQDLTYSRVWAFFRIAWNLFGPKPTDDLTRALITEMKDYVESNGAVFILMYLDQEPFEGLGVNTINPYVHGIPAWARWRIPGDGHYNAKAQKRIAALVAEKFKEMHLLPQTESRQDSTGQGP